MSKDHRSSIKIIIPTNFFRDTVIHHPPFHFFLHIFSLCIPICYLHNNSYRYPNSFSMSSIGHKRPILMISDDHCLRMLSLPWRGRKYECQRKKNFRRPAIFLKSEASKLRAVSVNIAFKDSLL